ncbi:FeoA family protein [Methanonatronarchaeum sp. AMET-Sl]|uniref:FeoA family protein n=1 Tax=Methanonatronarchaeum sp. AMET-Sl TaxID=3037654 RepID=UPI00244E4E4A|nr:FeoA family protein [Methanonatronarchaeum sp. AMET-Sl]WGI18122.1 FeoA family protein [Methanonatronarchaeum sp. AMET-Sl]
MSTGTRFLRFAVGLFGLGSDGGEVGSDGVVSLDCLDSGCVGVIREAPDHSLLAPLGLRVGKEVKVVSRQVFGGPVVVEVDGRASAVDRGLCCEIKIEPLDDLHVS